MSAGIHRKRLACVECTRRKVKCDKILPCRNCTRKGTECTRPREQDSQSPSIPRSDESTEQAIRARPSTDASLIIERLQSRVDHLEAALREASEFRRRKVPRLQGPLNGTSFSPARSIVGQPSPFFIPDSAIAEPRSTPKEVEDAATILEFLAWGRRKDPSYQDEIVKRSHLAHSPGDLPGEADWENSLSSGPSAITLCQLLLPTKAKVYQLVRYHCECLLWYHGAFHATMFLEQLDAFYSQGGGLVDGPGVDLQWISLLFAILTASLASAPASITLSWGFRGQERETLSHRWLQACIACLHQADYMACHSIYSVQSIATLTISAHMLGHSNGFSVLLASAVRIAQGLGLHQLDGDHDDRASSSLGREIGRRVWCQLCIQDWFSIPFTESYLIHRLCFNTEKPRNCDDDLVTLPDDHPTVTGYSRLFYDIAALMPTLQDDFNSSNTLYTRYEEVLKYDRQLRTLATQRLPRYLQNVSTDPSWPRYVPWARRSLAISSAHKVIMIHRKFLSLSFVNPMFEFTRKTCVAASRTIIKEQKEATDENGPLLWIHQAFSVTASIILCLDMFHHPAIDTQASEHRQLVEDGIAILSRCESDMIARRGVSLLKAMLGAEQQGSWRKHPATESCEAQVRLNGGGLDIATIIQTFYRQDQESYSNQSPSRLDRSSTTKPSNHEHWPSVMHQGPISIPTDELLVPFGVEYAEGLDDILSLATNYLN